MKKLKQRALKYKALSVDIGNGERAEFMMPQDSREALKQPRSVAEGKTDGGRLAALLEVTEAEATRRAVAMALEELERDD